MMTLRIISYPYSQIVDKTVNSYKHYSLFTQSRCCTTDLCMTNTLFFLLKSTNYSRKRFVTLYLYVLIEMFQFYWIMRLTKYQIGIKKTNYEPLTINNWHCFTFIVIRFVNTKPRGMGPVLSDILFLHVFKIKCFNLFRMTCLTKYQIGI
jgi:hypothetical protein